MTKLTIAIDGPAGAGKSTVAKRTAQALGLAYLDTGAMYRALALKAHRAGLGPTDGDAAAKLGAETRIAFGEGNPQPVLLDGEDVSAAIREPHIGELASALSTHVGVRQRLVEQQKAIIARGGAVLEGRDATTVIAPDATVKVFLTASLEERARRRFEELKASGSKLTYNEVRREVATRDHRDITRDESPLSVAEGATVIESACLTIEGVVEKILSLVPNR